MPPVFIQPGLGESLNRYLERLGRRGEEQRALQAERNNIQASMDARAAEVRTRMISQSIDQSVGLFTDEMQRDRASQRRLGEAENLQYLKGRPARLESQAAYGLTTLWEGGALEQLNKSVGIPTLLAKAHARINSSPNTLMPKETNTRSTATGHLQEYASSFLDDKLSSEDYVRASLKAIEDLNNIHPSGSPKKTLKANTIIGTGFGEGGNGIPDGMIVSVDQHGVAKKLDIGADEYLKEQMDTLLDADNPLWDIWNRDPDKENKKEPLKNLTYEQAEVMAFKRVATWNTMQKIANGSIPPEELARLLAGVVPQLEGPAVAGATAQPSGEKSTAFGGLTKKELDAKVKESGPVVLTDERGQPMIHPNKAGQPSTVIYMGNGRIGLIPRLGSSPIPSAPPQSLDSLIRP